jgi:asparagine synthase (glutamine-hydrolysing)
MCGLAAIFSYQASAVLVDQEELIRISQAMINRGPDGEGLWISDDKRIGLAHRRLSIIDLSRSGAQPMTTSDNAIRIVYNGEIYNFRELRHGLELKGYRFRSNSDTEVLLYLYQEYGQEIVHYLRGMYAFVIWDRHNRGIFLARDPLGIKPLYYADDGITIRIASQVKALLKGGQVDTNPEPAGHVGFFLWGHVPEPYTLYKGIRVLPAGTSLWIDTLGHKESKQFFNVSDEFAKASETRLNLSPHEMHERLRAALLDSVRQHLIADVPVGIFLSAGLDSTTLLALAKDLQTQSHKSLHNGIGGKSVGMVDKKLENALHTVTLGFKEFEGSLNDEVPLAELVAKKYDTIHQTRWLTREDFRSEYERLLEFMDQPTTDGVNSYFVSKAAKEAGLKVALSGIGGDELFGGYPSFNQIPSVVKTLRPFKFAPTLGKGFRYISSPILKHFTSPKYAGLLEYGGTYGGAYMLRRGMYMPWELPKLLDGEMVRQGWEELNSLSRMEHSIQNLNNTHLKITALETQWYMRNQLLRDTDWASMAHSLEIRTPLVDIELFRSVAPLLNSAQAPRKIDMALTPSISLPDEIVQRKKTGFSVPLREWLKPEVGPLQKHRGLREWACAIYASQTLS